MISHEDRLHNAATGPARLLVPLLVLLIAAGCGDGGGDGSSGVQTADADTEVACDVTCDDSAWREFIRLGEQATAGGDLTGPELTAFGEQPMVAVWRASLAPNEPSPTRVGSWLEATFWTELGREGVGKRTVDRRTISRSWRYSWEHRAEVDSTIALYTAGPEACRLREFAALWFDDDEMPSPLGLAFLPGRDELRFQDGTVLIDTGVLIAGQPEQLRRQVTALIWRSLGLLEGPSPLGLSGADAVAQTMRVLQHEGIAAWIEDRPNTYFRPDHYRLGTVMPIPETFFQTGIRTIAVLDANLPGMLADPAVMTRKGETVTRAIAGSGGFSNTGYTMAATIAGNLGEDRLRAVARSVPAFLAAYQEAALLNPVPRPKPGAIGSRLHETMPPFAPDVFPGLLALVEAAFVD